jgi:hypothetical protein
MPAALVPDPAHLKPAKAPQLRKLIDVAFKRLFAKSNAKLAGGDTGPSHRFAVGPSLLREGEGKCG